MKITDEMVTLAMSAYSSVDGGLTLFPDAMRTALEAALSAQPQTVATHRHKKRGSTYELVGIGQMQAEHWIDPRELDDPAIDMAEVAVYRATEDGSLWVRPREEFEDGRFEVLSVAALTTAPAQEPVAEIVAYRGPLCSLTNGKDLKLFVDIGNLPLGAKFYLTPPDQSARIAGLEAALADIAADRGQCGKCGKLADMPENAVSCDQYHSCFWIKRDDKRVACAALKGKGE